MLQAMSWMKAPPRAAASAGDKGGASRVLTSPTRGALAMIATAQVSVSGGGNTPSSPVPLQPGARHRGDDPQRGVRAVGLAFFEIAGVDRHLVGDVGEAQHRLAAGSGKGVERGSLHLDRQDIA